MVSALSILDGEEDSCSECSLFSNLSGQHLIERETNMEQMIQASNLSPAFTNQVSFLEQSKSISKEDWQKATDMFHNKPSLMTSTILRLTLRHRPPANLVRLILSVNPEAAAPPKQGPTALQIAIQQNCSVDVIKELIAVCPVATNPGSYLDPLSYARRFRPDEPELIELLTRPLSHWMANKNLSITSTKPKEIKEPSYSYGPTPKPALKQSAQSLVRFPTYAVTKTKAYPDYSAVESLEMKNLKLICVSLLKKHKHLWKEMQSMQTDFLQLLSKSNDSNSESTLESMVLAAVQKELEKQTFQYQSASAASEHVMLADIFAAENRLLTELQKAKTSCAKSIDEKMEALCKNMEYRFHGVTARLDRIESKLQRMKRSKNSPLSMNRRAVSRNFTVNTTKDTNTVRTISSSGTFIDTTIVFATPYEQEDCRADISLLTEEKLSGREPTWRPWASSKRLLVILFQK